MRATEGIKQIEQWIEEYHGDPDTYSAGQIAKAAYDIAHAMGFQAGWQQCNQKVDEFFKQWGYPKEKTR